MVLWSLLLAGSALLSGGTGPDPAKQRAALLLVAVAAACVAGYLLPRGLAPAYGLGVALGIGGLILLTPDGLSGRALAGPLGYGNANGALCAQGAAAACVAALACRRRPARLAALTVGTGLALLAWQTGSRAGTATAAGCIALAAVALAGSGADTAPGPARWIIRGAAATSAVVLALTVTLGLAHDPQGAHRGLGDRVAERALSERRPALWSESLDLLNGAPATGVGVGGFADASRTARADQDARWAHSAFLQHGAEAGVPGLATLLGLSGAAYVALWRAAERSVLAVAGTCALTAALTHAMIDYVLHFPVIPLLTALTVGVCVGPGRRRQWRGKSATRPRSAAGMPPHPADAASGT